MPSQPVVLFDGHCILCNALVDRLIRLDRRRALRLAPLQSRAGRDLLRAHGLDPDRRDTLVVVADGELRLRSDAALTVAAHLPPPWSWLRALRLMPRSWRDRLYGAVARRRQRWFGTCESCRVPTERDRERFLPGADEIDGP